MTHNADGLSEVETKELEQLLEKHKNDSSSALLRNWHMLRTYDATTDAAKRKELLEKICDANRFEDAKPSLPEGIKAYDSSTDDENDDRSKLPADFLQVLPSESNLTLA